MHNNNRNMTFIEYIEYIKEEASLSKFQSYLYSLTFYLAVISNTLWLYMNQIKAFF